MAIKSKFVFVKIEIGRTSVPTKYEIINLTNRELRRKKTYRRFAEVPVEAYSIVVRVDYRKGEPYDAWECAYAKTVTNLNGTKSLAYVTSSNRAGRYAVQLAEFT